MSVADGKVDLHTTFVDWINDDAFVLSVDKNQNPKSCVAFGHATDMNNPAMAAIPVAFEFKRQDVIVGHWYWAKKGRPEEITDYSLPLPKVITGSTNAQSKLDRSLMRELIICDAGGLVITNRMPAESNFFGYPVRSCLALKNHVAFQWYTNINGSGVQYARVQHPDKDFDPDQENAKSLTKETCRQLFLDNQFKAWADTYSELVYRTVASTNETSAKTLSAEQAHEREKALFQFMQLIRNKFDLVLTDETSLFLDPFVRGTMLEQALWRPDRHPATITDLLSLVMGDLESSSGELSLSHSLFCAYADLGLAPNDKSFAFLGETQVGGKLSDLDSAAILARWRMETAPRHVEAVAKHIKTSKHMTDRMNCVETLILMEQFDHIPSDLMQRWFAGIKGDADQIRRPLNLLMQNATGRRYLADKYKEMSVDAPLREPIKALFENELSAVHEFGDYRFWTREECKQLESDLQLEFASAGDEKQ
ncbi:hypothetical protein [Novipirellula caenicola]|uniref:hypothetical protein n=1 Tax=Novipirellula caenicola TaxID=1536901 RepID=UPI0031EB29FE